MSKSIFPVSRVLPRSRAFCKIGCSSRRKLVGFRVHCASVGIDLGTTNSAVSVIRDGKPHIVKIGGDSVIPSVVSYLPDGIVLVGKEAVFNAASNPSSTFYSVKRLTGRSFQEVSEEVHHLVYDVVPDSKDQAAVFCPALDRVLAPEDINRHILQCLIQAAEDDMQQRVDSAVITVPVHFGTEQRAATVRAAHMAGIKTVQLLQEPVAAAIAYGLVAAQRHDTILVFDMGGGTFDVSALSSDEGVVEVLGSGGDPWLGGDNFDTALVQWLLDDVITDQTAAWSHPSAMQRLYKAAETAKIALSSQEEVTIKLDDIIPGATTSVGMSRSQFHDIIVPLLYRIVGPLEDIGKDAFIEWHTRPADALCSDNRVAPGNKGTTKLSSDKYAPPPRRISQAILVGGATRMPALREFVEGITGVRPRDDVDPEQCVALGAAVQAGLMMGEVAGLEIMDGLYTADWHDRVSGFMGV